MRDREREVRLAENGFWYRGEFRRLDERTILLDGGMTDGEAASGPHLYRDIREALAAPELSGSRTHNSPAVPDFR